MSKHTTQIKIIGSLLNEAMNEGLEVEVIYDALLAMRDDDAITPSEAMQLAVDGWIK